MIPDTLLPSMPREGNPPINRQPGVSSTRLSPLFCRHCGCGNLRYVGKRVAHGKGGLELDVVRCEACGWLWWLRP